MSYHYTHLQKRNPEKNQHRFYMLNVQPNLFKGFSLIREWGRIGSAGRVKVDFHDRLKSAEASFLKLERAKQRRHYKRVAS